MEAHLYGYKNALKIIAPFLLLATLLHYIHIQIFNPVKQRSKYIAYYTRIQDCSSDRGIVWYTGLSTYGPRDIW